MGIIGLFFGAIAAFWVYRDAKRNGQDRNAALAWSLGVVAAATAKLPLLLLALAAYFLIGRKKQLPKKRDDANIIDVDAEVVEEIRETCPSCGRKVEKTYTVCPFCGCKLSIK